MDDLAKFEIAKKIAEEQAEDGSLWFITQTITEALLQKELRRIHAAIEGDSATLKLIDLGVYDA